MAKKIDVNGLDHYHEKVSAMVAEAYSSSKTYAVGDYCFHAGTLYKCTTAIATAEAWTSGHWTAAKLADDLSEQSEAITSVKGTLLDNGCLYTDLMVNNYATSASRRLYVDKNHVRLAKVTSSTSTAYRTWPLIGAVAAISNGWSSADLSNQTYIPLNIDAVNNDLVLTFVWGTKHENTVRNQFCVATKNPTTSVVTKAVISADTVTNAIQKVSLFDICPEIKSNGNFNLFYESRTSEYLNSLTYWISIENLQTFSKNVNRVANPYSRYTLKEYGKTIDGFSHTAFPNVALFAGKEVVSYAASQLHTTPVDPSNWGGVMIDTRAQDGTWEHVGLIDTTSVGVSGEFRGTDLCVSRDGKTLFLSGFTTYRNVSDPNTDLHDNYILKLNSNFEVVDSYVETNVSKVFCGKCLETPDGYLLQGAYSMGSAIVKRSTTAFDETLSTMAFDSGVELFTQSDNNEIDIGYWNDKLVAINRRDAYYFRVSYTSNLEGTSGWTAEAAASSGGFVLHKPTLLPYFSGDYLPFVGAKREDTTVRAPVLGLLGLDSNDAIYVKTWGNVDPSITKYSSYSGFVYLGGDVFGMAYYEEDTSWIQSGLYYKHVNLRELCADMAFV